MERFSGFLLIMGVTSILYGFVDYFLNNGKYEVERIDLSLPIIMVGVNLRILFEEGLSHFDDFIVSLMIAFMFAIVIFVMWGILVRVKAEYDVVDSILSKLEVLQTASVREELNKKIYTLENGTKMIIMNHKKTTEISIASKLNLSKIMKVRSQIVPALIEVDQRKYRMKDFFMLLGLGIGLIVLYLLIN